MSLYGERSSAPEQRFQLIALKPRPSGAALNLRREQARVTASDLVRMQRVVGGEPPESLEHPDHGRAVPYLTALERHGQAGRCAPVEAAVGGEDIELPHIAKPARSERVAGGCGDVTPGKVELSLIHI